MRGITDARDSHGYSVPRYSKIESESAKENVAVGRLVGMTQTAQMYLGGCKAERCKTILGFTLLDSSGTFILPFIL